MSIEASSGGEWSRGARAGSRVGARLLPIGLALLATLVMLPGLQSLAPLWLGGVDSPYAQGPLLALVAVYLMWRDGATVDREAASPSRLALVALGGVSILWAVAQAAQVASLSEALWPLGSWLTIAAVLGMPAARRYAVALGLLYFALPVWVPLVEHVLWPLASSVPPLLLKLIGTPVFADGHLIHIPEGVFEVAEGCTGLHFFLAAVILAVLIAHLERATLREWLVLVGVAIALALIVNWIRIAMVVEAGHLTQMRHPWVTVDHRPLGWALFAVAVVGYCLGVRRWLPPRAIAPLAREAVITTGIPSRSSALPGMALAALLALVIGPVWAAAADSHQRALALHPAIALPEAVRGLGARRDSWNTDWQPVFHGAAQELRATYGDAPHVLYAYSNSYGPERAGAKLIYYANSILGEHWRAMAISRKPIGVEVIAQDAAGSRWVLQYAYVSADQFAVNPVRVKLLSAMAVLMFHPDFKGIVATAAPCAVSCDAARGASEPFWHWIGEPAADKDRSKT